MSMIASRTENARSRIQASALNNPGRAAFCGSSSSMLVADPQHRIIEQAAVCSTSAQNATKVPFRTDGRTCGLVPLTDFRRCPFGSANRGGRRQDVFLQLQAANFAQSPVSLYAGVRDSPVL